MGEDKTRRGKSNSLRRRNYNPPNNHSRNPRCGTASKRIIAGIDLGAGRSPTVLAIATIGHPHEGHQPITLESYEHPWDAVRSILRRHVTLVAVDAPLHPPKGRGLRNVEKKLAKHTGTPLLPCSFRGMAKLCLLGVSIRNLLEEAGIYVLETYPAAAARRCGLTRPRRKPFRDMCDARIALAAAFSECTGRSYRVCTGVECIVLPDCVILAELCGPQK